MATPFSYTVPNWREGTPNAAETAIYGQMMTPQMGGSGGLGIVLGNELAANRHINERNYMDELAQQHAFAQQQADRHAAAQQQENLLKLISDADKNAGTLGLAYNNPSLRPLLAGTDEDMMGQFAQFTKQQNDAKAYEATGKGYREFREGGGYTPPGVIANLLAPAGVQIQDTTPTAILAAQARGLADATPRINATGAPDPLNGGASTGASLRPGIGETPEQARQRALDLVNPRSLQNRPIVPAVPSPVSDVLPQAPATGGGAQASPASPLPAGSPPVPPPGQAVAPTATPNQKMDVAPSGTPGKAEAQRAAAAAIPKLAQINRAAWQSVMSRMADEGGDVPINYLPGTGWVYVGKEGIFEIPGVTRSLTTDRSGRNGVMR